MFANNKAVLLLALFAGAAYVFAFAPFEVSLLAYICLGVLFWLWTRATDFTQAFLIGWFFGLGQFGIGVSWVYVSLTTFGGMPAIMAGFAVCLFVMGLAVFPAVVGLLQQLFRRAGLSTRLLLIMAPFWVVVEWLREWFLTGLPWLSAGYSQSGNFLSGLAPLGGVYLVSLVVVLITASIVLFVTSKKGLSLLIAPALLLCSYMLWAQSWTVKTDTALSVKLVQGNISIWDKWNPKKADEILENYLELSEQGQKTDLVIWPEAAAPVLINQLPETFWKAIQSKENTYTLFGVIERNAQTGAFYNSVVSTQKDGSLAYYRKIHLVPFGEFLPLEFLLQWLLDYLHIPMSDFSAYDTSQPPITVKGVKIGVSICYEDAFANLIRTALPEADLLVNVSEDAWFGNSLAPHQRLQMAQMRAIENGRTLIRVSNNGLSSIIDHRGNIKIIAPQFTTHVSEGMAEVRAGVTPFSLWGHILVLSLLGFLFMLAIILQFVAQSKPRAFVRADND